VNETWRKTIFSGGYGELRRRVGRVAVPVGQATIVDADEDIPVGEGYAGGEMIRELFGFFRLPQTELLAVAAGAVALEYRFVGTLFLLAAVGDLLLFLFLIMQVFQFLLPAAAGVTGAPLGGAAADGTIPSAFARNGVGDGSRLQGKRHQRSHRDQQIDHNEDQSLYVP
jgi:hypothetical protein